VLPPIRKKMDIDKYNLNTENEKELWQNAIFIFDTSSILNFYEYSKPTINDLFSTTLTDLKDRLWLPYNVSSEYINNRNKPINKAKNTYDNLKRNIKVIYDNFEQIKNRTKSKEKHPYVSSDIFSELETHLTIFKTKLESEIITKEKELDGIKVNDEILLKIKTFFSIGTEFSYSEITDIIKEGEFRYRNSIPPGYKDENDKLGFQKYGDLIIWKQIINEAKKSKKPVIFIMDDLKEDWWILNKKRQPISPRTELIDEILEISNNRFWMYKTDDFFVKSKFLIHSKIAEHSIENIKEISKITGPKNYKHIELSANREDDEPWRLKRLEDVAKFYNNVISDLNLSELYDHKGMLSVYWHKHPSEIEKATIESAWENENEPNDNVEHLILE
jgi:hypothetical protein